MEEDYFAAIARRSGRSGLRPRSRRADKSSPDDRSRRVPFLLHPLLRLRRHSTSARRRRAKGFIAAFFTFFSAFPTAIPAGPTLVCARRWSVLVAVRPEAGPAGEWNDQAFPVAMDVHVNSRPRRAAHPRHFRRGKDLLHTIAIGVRTSAVKVARPHAHHVFGDCRDPRAGVCILGRLAEPEDGPRSES